MGGDAGNLLIIMEDLKELDKIAMGNRLKLLRYHHGMTQKEVMIALDYKSPATVWCLEHGQLNMTVETLFKICQLYKCNCSVLLGLTS